VLLQRLAALARAPVSPFGNADDEATRLSVTINAEMTQLWRRLEDLRTWVRETDLGTGRDAQRHSENVVLAMVSRLQDSRKEHLRVEEQRKHALEKQSQRMRMFGGEDDFDMGKPLSFGAPALAGSGSSAAQTGASPNHVHPTHAGRVNANHLVTLQPPQFSHLTQQQQQAQPAQQLVLIPDNQHLRARVDAIAAVQTSIVELGQVMSNLSTLIQEQDPLINDIAGNVENAAADARAGILQLQRYYESIRGNRQLVARLFAVLAVFLIGWMVFLA